MMNDKDTAFGAWVTEHHEAIAILYFRFFTDTMQTAIEEDDDEAIEAIMPLDNFVFRLWKEREAGKDLVDLFEKRKREQEGFAMSDQILNQRFSNN
tara:strand:- start:1239 stop:1526 length:288 start_codon:yes stop_codon:yes gene_type:complete